MFLPAPDKPIRHLPRVTVYHYYPMDVKLEKDVVYKDARGNMNKKAVSEYAVAYMNLVMPQRDADVYRRNKDRLSDFGMDYIVDFDASQMRYHNCYGMDETGARALTNVIVWHKHVYDGANPDVARVVIGNESILVSAMESMLKYYTDVPFLKNHVSDIVSYARSLNVGAIQFKGSNEWVAPIWYLVKDKKLWNDIVQKYFKR